MSYISDCPNQLAGKSLPQLSYLPQLSAYCTSLRFLVHNIQVILVTIPDCSCHFLGIIIIRKSIEFSLVNSQFFSTHLSRCHGCSVIYNHNDDNTTIITRFPFTSWHLLTHYIQQLTQLLLLSHSLFCLTIKITSLFLLLII